MELPSDQTEGGDYFRDAILHLDDALEYVESFEDSIEPTLNELSLDEVRSPLLNHVGIIDIDKAWRAIANIAPIDENGRSLRSNLAHAYPVVGNVPIYSARLEFEKQLFKKLGMAERAFIGGEGRQRSVYQHYFAALQNEFYPVGEGSLISELADTSLWRRTLGIPQLGWKDNYPLENLHSRGSHSLFAAVNKARVLQGLYEACPDKLVQRLRQDFTGEEFYDESMSDEAVVLLAVELAVVVGMTHDIYTPAGGDMMKHVMGMDEEADASQLLDADDERVKEFVAVLEKHGLGEDHLRFAVKCIQGNSTSLVGEMIHVEVSDVLEQDRLAYTVQDLFSAGILGPAIPLDLISDTALPDNEKSLWEAWDKAEDILGDNTTWSASPIMTGRLRPSLSLLDVSGDYVLSEGLELVCTRPDKLAWLAAFRAMMSMEFYRGAKLQGQEQDLRLALESLIESGRADKVLNSENLLRIDNYELIRQLRSLNDAVLNKLLDDIDKMIYHRIYASELVSEQEEVADAWVTVRMSLKPGLDTKVLDNGEVVALGTYMAQRPELLPVHLFVGVVVKHEGKKRIIRKAEQL